VKPVAIAAAIFLLAGCGGTTRGSTAELRAATPTVAKRLLTARLQAQHLTFHWVACLRTGRTYNGVAVVRCNVNFGDPHIEAYCSVLKGPRLLTDHEDHAIPCRHDDAGPAPTIVES
jgi:4-hydroxy-3-methylbut-2-en-1-yl diphosphate synthase IspG/GcpE